jgi:hypothetical protein
VDNLTTRLDHSVFAASPLEPVTTMCVTASQALWISDEQKAERRTPDCEHRELGARAQEERGQSEGDVEAARQYRVPEPVFEHRLVTRLAAGSADHDRAVGEPAETAHGERG